MEMNVEAGTPETPEEREARLAKLLENWRSAIGPKKEWTAYEATMRLEVAKEYFPSPAKGTNRVTLPTGEKLKLIYGTTYTLGNKELVDPVLQEKVPVETQVQGVLDAIEDLGPGGKLLAARLVKWKPELNEVEYKLLCAETAGPLEVEARKLIDSILTTKPASPQMEIEPVKAAK